MRKIITLSVLLFSGTVVACAPAMVDKMNAAHKHIGHVMMGWKDTPDKKGFLPTAIAEAMIADQHAGFAASKPDDLKWMQTHALHVLHAIDPTAIAKGPGLGYGASRAAAGAAKHIGFAAATEGASENIKLHATHVAASANNAVERSGLILIEIEKVGVATTAGAAAPHIARIKELTAQLLAGFDANGDGKISWEPGEGGLSTAKQHMGFMMKGEGMS